MSKTKTGIAVAGALTLAMASTGAWAQGSDLFGGKAGLSLDKIGSMATSLEVIEATFVDKGDIKIGSFADRHPSSFLGEGWEQGSKAHLANGKIGSPAKNSDSVEPAIDSFTGNVKVGGLKLGS